MASPGRPKTHVCDGCGKAFAKPSRLAEHQSQHTGVVSIAPLLVNIK